MKALTLSQPLAQLAAIGAKRLDGRGWRTPYLGPVAIYAARWQARMTYRELRALCMSEPIRGLLYSRPIGGLHRAPWQPRAGERHLASARELPRGQIIAVGELLDCRRLEDGEDVPTGIEAALGAYRPLMCVWELGDAEPLLVPVPVARGVARGGLWAMPRPLRRAVEAVQTLAISRRGEVMSLAPARVHFQSTPADSPPSAPAGKPKGAQERNEDEMKTQMKKNPAVRIASARAKNTPEMVIPEEAVALNPSAQPGRLGFETVKPSDIGPSPTNPRRHFDEAAMAELVESVRRHGVMQPVLVRRNPRLMGPRYELVAGERRWRAATMAKLSYVPVTIRDLSDEEALELQAIENLQRQDLSPMEEAAGYQTLLKLPGYSMGKLVERTGRSESTIRGKMKLLDLPEPARAAVDAGTLAPSTAELIARASANVREELTRRILKPTGWRSGNEKGPLSFQEARREVDQVEEEAKRARAYQVAAEKAKAAGLTVLSSEDSAGIVPSYGDGTHLHHNCGYLRAAEKCADDPKGRTYAKIFEEAEGGPERFAAINREGKIFEVLRRDQVTPLLKRLKLWRAKGSKALAEKEKIAGDKQRAADKLARDHAAVAALVGAIERSGPGRLPVSFWKQLAVEMAEEHGGPAQAVANRRELSHSRKGGPRLVMELAAERDGGAAVGLLAEMLVGSRERYGFKDRLGRLNEALGILPDDVDGPGLGPADVCESGEAEEHEDPASDEIEGGEVLGAGEDTAETREVAHA